jgi:hypothetical protein
MIKKSIAFPAVLGAFVALTLAACGGGSGSTPVVSPPPVVVDPPPPPTFPVSVTVRDMPPDTRIEVRNGPDTMTVTRDGTYQFPTRLASQGSFKVSYREGPFIACNAPSPAGVAGTSAPEPVLVTCSETGGAVEEPKNRVGDVLVATFMGYETDYRLNKVTGRNVAAEFYRVDYGTGRWGFKAESYLDIEFRLTSASSLAKNEFDIAVTDTCNGVVRLLNNGATVLAGRAENQCDPDGHAVAPKDGTGAEARFDLPGPITASALRGDYFLAGATPNLLRRISREGVVSSIHLTPANGTALPGKIRSVVVALDETTLYVTGEGGVWKVVGEHASLLAPLAGAGKLVRRIKDVFVYGNGAIYSMSADGRLTLKEQLPASDKFDMVDPIWGNTDFYSVKAPFGLLTVMPRGAQPAVNAQGELLLPNQVNGTVFSYVNSLASGFVYDEVVFGKGFVLPHTLANNAAGDVLVLDRTSASTFAIKSPDNRLTFISAAGDATGAQLAYGPSGLVGVALPTEKSVRIYRIDGTLLNTATLAFLPEALAFDSTGQLYISEAYGKGIYRMGKTGAATAFTQLIRMDAAEPRSMAIDHGGNIYLSGSLGIIRITPSGVQTSPRMAWGDMAVTGLTARNGYLYGVRDGVAPIRHKFN